MAKNSSEVNAPMSITWLVLLDWIIMGDLIVIVRIVDSKLEPDIEVLHYMIDFLYSPLYIQFLILSNTYIISIFLFLFISLFILMI